MKKSFSLLIAGMMIGGAVFANGGLPEDELPDFGRPDIPDVGRPIDIPGRPGEIGRPIVPGRPEVPRGGDRINLPPMEPN